MLSVWFTPRYFVISLADTICSSRGGEAGGERRLFLSLGSGRLCVISKPFNIRTCPVLSFLLVSTYKEKNFNGKRCSSAPPPPKKGNLKSLLQELAYGQTWAGHLCVASPGWCWKGPGGGDPSHPQRTLPGGARPHGKRSRRRPGREPGRSSQDTQASSALPRPQPRVPNGSVPQNK